MPDTTVPDHGGQLLRPEIQAILDGLSPMPAAVVRQPAGGGVPPDAGPGGPEGPAHAGDPGYRSAGGHHLFAITYATLSETDHVALRVPQRLAELVAPEQQLGPLLIKADPARPGGNAGAHVASSHVERGEFGLDRLQIGGNRTVLQLGRSQPLACPGQLGLRVPDVGLLVSPSPISSSTRLSCPVSAATGSPAIRSRSHVITWREACWSRFGWPGVTVRTALARSALVCSETYPPPAVIEPRRVCWP